MTRNRASPHRSLPVRSRGTGDNVEGNAQQARNHGHYPALENFHPQSQQLSDVHQYSMYSFGSEPSVQASHEFPPALSPEMEFPVSTPYDYDGPSQDDLLSTFMSSEIANSGDIFEDYPSMIEEEFSASTPLWPSISSVTPHHVGFGTGLHHAHMLKSTFSVNAHQGHLPPPSYIGLPSAIPYQPIQAPIQAPIQLPPPTRKPPRAIRPKGAGEPHPAPPDTCSLEDDSNGRGRKRVLSPEGRLSARRVRLMRACGRCHALKGKCETRRPCKPCLSRNKRSYDFPCMPELPEDRWTHLFTEEMYGHLELKAVYNRMPEPFRDASNKPFTLRLHQYFDDPELTIPVIRFIPLQRKDINKATFPIESNGKVLEVNPTEILSPPLVPAINNANFADYFQRFRWSVRRWLDCAEMHHDIEWHLTFFREEYGKPWPRVVFGNVCQFYHKVEWGSCAALKSGLQSTVFAYMLGHSFYIPEEDIKSVVDKTGLSHLYNGDFMFVSPIHVDRFVKAMLYPIFRTCVGKTLRGLQDLCAPSRQSKYSRDRILATSIVLLIVAASQQSKAVEKAEAMRLRGEYFDKRVTRNQIAEIEEYIINLVLQIWDYKFRGNVRWGDDEPSDRSSAYRAKLFGLLEKFESSYQLHCDSLQSLSTELPEEINERTFGATNVDRVLKKFYFCVFINQQGTPYTEPEPSMQEWDSYPPAERKPFSTAERESKYSSFAYAEG